MSRSDSTYKSDVIIIGGGLAGTLAATVFSKNKYSVILIDKKRDVSPEFRAEQLVGSQVSAMSRLGVLENVVGARSPVAKAHGYRHGIIAQVVKAQHYASPYAGMVSNARDALPTKVRFIEAQVNDIQLSDNKQSVKTSTGETFEARLVIMATGHEKTLKNLLNIQTRIVSENHSLSLGFDIEVADISKFRERVLVTTGQRRGNKSRIADIDYATAFEMDGKVRVNIFTNLSLKDPWIGRFTANPVEALREAIPSFERYTGPILSHGKVERRWNHLKEAENVPLNGLVLIGDADRTSCPAAGTGIGRLLNDIEVLASHVPTWFASEGMGPDKISKYYSDPRKVEFDAQALHDAKYRRNVTIAAGVYWLDRSTWTRENLKWSVHRNGLVIKEKLMLAANVVTARLPLIGQRKIAAAATIAPSLPTMGLNSIATPAARPGGGRLNRITEALKARI